MLSEAIEHLPMPINFARWSEANGLVSTHPQLFAAIHDLEPQLSERDIERVDHHLTEVMEAIAKGRGHLPKDVVPTPGQGEMTHILNGRLLRRRDVWVGLMLGEDRDSLHVVSVNRANSDQLVSILGGGQYKGAVRSKGSVSRFRNH